MIIANSCRAVALLLSAAALPAQIQGGHALVLTNGPRPGVGCELLDVDLTSGSFRPVGRFPADARSGLAATVDPVLGDAVVVLAAAPASLVVRVSLQGGVAGAETTLGVVPGTVTDVAVALHGDIYCTTGGASGAVFEIPRTGGVATPIAPAPFATALGSPNLGSAVLLVALSGDRAAGAHPGVQIVDALARQVLTGPYYFVGHQPLGITGIRFRYLPPNLAFVDEGGNMWLLSLPSTVRRFGQIPPLPAGGLRALTLQFRPLRWVALGGAAHPFLKTLPDLTTYAGGWTDRAGPLPGDPVDFGLQLDTPRLAGFGQPCRRASGVPLGMRASGPPRVGDPTFSLGVGYATPGSPILLAVGTSDLLALGTVPLPYRFPGGCELLVSPDVTVPLTADGSGDARQTIPIPADPALVGVALLAQGVELAPGRAPVTSGGLALHIGS